MEKMKESQRNEIKDVKMAQKAHFPNPYLTIFII